MTAQSPDMTSKWLEIAAALILSVASLVAAWSTYQANQWSRKMAISGGVVAASLLESTQLVVLSSQDTLIDVITFTNWLDAVNGEDRPLADFYRSRFREEFRANFEAWLALDPLHQAGAPSSPFVMPGYSPARRQAALELQEQASEKQQEMRNASDYVAFYVRNTLYLAVALFLIGVSRMFPTVKVRGAIQVIALGALLFSIVNVLGGPFA